MTDSSAPDSEIQAVLDAWSAALHAKDLDALAECYADDVRVFDLWTHCRSYAEVRALWEGCFPHFTKPIKVEREKLQITAGPELAVATFYSRVTGTEMDHPAATAWMRTTVCFQQQGGTWKIVHDHFSLPIDFENEKPMYLETPPDA